MEGLDEEGYSDAGSDCGDTGRAKDEHLGSWKSHLCTYRLCLSSLKNFNNGRVAPSKQEIYSVAYRHEKASAVVI